GPALADFADAPFAQAEIARLEESRLATVEQWIDAELQCGRHNALVGELESLVAAHPLRERLHGQLMPALYRSGRQADALAAYRRMRQALVADLGIDPSQPLQDLERAILAHDPAIEQTATASGELAVAPRPLGLGRRGKIPVPPTPLVGRQQAA